MILKKLKPGWTWEKAPMKGGGFFGCNKKTSLFGGKASGSIFGKETGSNYSINGRSMSMELLFVVSLLFFSILNTSN